jgi:hypothetical protein
MKSRKSMLLVSLLGIALLGSGAVLARGGGMGGFNADCPYNQAQKQRMWTQTQQFQARAQLQTQLQPQVRQRLRDPASCAQAAQNCPWAQARQQQVQ